MATGAGKSLCFYIVPLALGSLAVGIVISPLNALMDQQVIYLLNAGVSALRVTSNEEYPSACEGKYRFVFMSPEHAVAPPWRGLFCCDYYKRHLAVVAIDEAHCIADWGADFRQSFSKLGGLRALTNSPFMALTATAPPHVEAELISSLHMRNPVVVRQPLDRPNIYFSASRSAGMKRELGRLAHLFSTVNSLADIPKTIIFSQTKDDVYTTFSFLHGAAKYKKSVAMYHASQSQETKTSIQTTYASSRTELRCICATIAFGLGMDVNNVEAVIVNGPPDTLAQLYQMFGRAGRGGGPARAHLYYTNKQAEKLKDASLQCFASPGGSENCSRQEMLRLLGSNEVVASNEACCDVCSGGVVPSHRLDILVSIPVTRPRKPKAIRCISRDMQEALKIALLQERNNILEEFPGYKIIGGWLYHS